MKRIAFVASATFSLLGCDHTGALRERAAFDLSCPADELALTELGSRGVQGVTGCGRRATYVYVSHTGWVMNTDSRRRP